LWAFLFILRTRVGKKHSHSLTRQYHPMSKMMLRPDNYSQGKYITYHSHQNLKVYMVWVSLPYHCKKTQIQDFIGSKSTFGKQAFSVVLQCPLYFRAVCIVYPSFCILVCSWNICEVWDPMSTYNQEVILFYEWPFFLILLN
jgi:hypothetical protein